MGLTASVPPPPPPVRPGDVVAGKYVVDREIAAGGMGLVFSARHVELDQAVALKFMRAELRGQISTSRFTLEARATAKLRSAHVARVFDVGVLEDGTPYMVMELLEGIDLERLIEDRGRLSPEIAAELVTQACEAVAEAHNAGIIHRDLKPANLFLTKTPQGAPFVKVLDFGISKATIDAPTRATAAGTIMGSPPYMSPETLKSSRNANVQSDVWALGVILYELATGRLPFDGEGVGDIALKVHHDEPVWPAVLDPTIPKEYDDIVRSCLQKDPSKRFSSAIELRDALVAFSTSRGTGAMTLSLRTTSPRIVVVDDPEPAPTTPRTAERLHKGRSSTTMVPTKQPSDPPRRPSPSRRVLVSAVGVGAAIAAAAVLLATTRTPVPRAAASSAEGSPAAITAHASVPAATPSPVQGPADPIVAGPIPAAAIPVASASTTEPSPAAVTANAPSRPAPRTTAKTTTPPPASAAPKEPAPTASLTPPPAPVQPAPAPSTGRGIRDRGF